MAFAPPEGHHEDGCTHPTDGKGPHRGAPAGIPCGVVRAIRGVRGALRRQPWQPREVHGGRRRASWFTLMERVSAAGLEEVGTVRSNKWSNFVVFLVPATFAVAAWWRLRGA